jgi:hypothetical protein
MISYFFIAAVGLLSKPIQDQPKFEPKVIDSNVQIGYGLAIGDVDGDKKPDILLADKKQFVWYRNGDWKKFVMVENLTTSDNVCIAARDINGDGKVEVAVGAQWNPGETSDTLRSGSVHFLIRPADPTQKWTPVKLYHEPTIHRMRWVKAGANTYHLLVVPLHGKGNKNGEGTPVNILAYEVPKDPRGKWKYSSIDQSMHLTHNFDLVESGNSELIYVGGKEGIRILAFKNGKWSPVPQDGGWFVQGESFGELRIANKSRKALAGIQPMHGNQLVVYSDLEKKDRVILTNDMNQGHALGYDELFGGGNDEIVVGWREPDKENKTGIKIYVFQNNKWNDYWVDDNGIACEDLQIADLNADGKKDIIAAGRASRNLKIYLNQN